MTRLTRDGTAESVSRDQILRHVRGQENSNLPCSADDYEQNWQPYPVDPYSAIICDNHAYILRSAIQRFRPRSSGRLMVGTFGWIHKIFQRISTVVLID